MTRSILDDIISSAVQIADEKKMTDEEWVDQYDSPNVHPYKSCTQCNERKSCGSYDADCNWLCENCHSDDEEEEEAAVKPYTKAQQKSAALMSAEDALRRLGDMQWLAPKPPVQSPEEVNTHLREFIQKQRRRLDELEEEIAEKDAELKIVREIVQCKRPNAEMEFGEDGSALRFIFAANRLQIYKISPEVLQEVGEKRLDAYFEYDAREGTTGIIQNRWAEFHPLSVHDVMLQEHFRKQC